MRKKNILSSLLFLLLALGVNAQDLIITQNQDSIIASIKKVRKNKLHYSTSSPYGITDYTQNWSEISDTIYGYYNQDIRDVSILKQLHKDTLRTKKEGLIYCNIVDEGLDYLVYSEVVKGRDVYHILPNEELANYRQAKDVRVLNEGISDDFIIVKKGCGKDDYPRYHIILASGYGRRLTEISQDLPADIKDFDKGFLDDYFISAGASYYFKKNWGLGAKFSTYRSYSTGKIALQTTEGELVVVPVSSNMHMNYLGGIFNFRTFSANGDFEFIAGVGAGAFYYRDYGNIAASETFFKANTFAMNMEVNFIYHITEYLGLNIHSSIIVGQFSDMVGTIGSSGLLDLGEEELNGNRLELGLGLSFRF